MSTLPTLTEEFEENGSFRVPRRTASLGLPSRSSDSTLPRDDDDDDHQNSTTPMRSLSLQKPSPMLPPMEEESESSSGDVRRVSFTPGESKSSATGGGAVASLKMPVSETSNLKRVNPSLRRKQRDSQTSGSLRRSGLQRGEGPMASFRGSTLTRSSRTLSNSIVRRSTALARFARPSSANIEEDAAAMRAEKYKRTTYRGYKVGDSVLICNHHSRRANQVNKYGFPPGEGSNPEEQRGPYIFVLAKVQMVHFEEFTVFYTVTREDTGEDVRAEADFMEPLKSGKGMDAARRVATEAIDTGEHEESGDEGAGGDGRYADQSGRAKCCRILENICIVLLLPFLWLYDCFIYVIGARLWRWGIIIRKQASLFLNGIAPYECSVRITMINVLVLCNTWYMFIDQARLAFFPTSADYTLAVINCVVWIVLVVELIFEVFIRPDGYHVLIDSDKAFAPMTVRFISGFHVVVESISLIFFVPEFLCLFTDRSCNDRYGFSFFNSALVAVRGSSAVYAFISRMFFACIRLRVFGLVRHWKNMWINKTFLSRSAKNSNDAPTRRPGGTVAPTDKAAEDPAAKKAAEMEAQKQRDAALINASNIGTALMVTNSYRALMILCAILGLFPMIGLLFPRGVTNPVTKSMIHQLQATNLLVTSENDQNCAFFAKSVRTWVAAFSGRETDIVTSSSDDFLLSLAIEPSRCVDEINFAFQDTFGGRYEAVQVDCMDLESEYDSQTRRVNILKRLKYGAGQCIFLAIDPEITSKETRAENQDIRVGAVQTQSGRVRHMQNLTLSNGTITTSNYGVVANFNQTHSVEAAALASFLLQLALLFGLLGGLSVLRKDAELLVLGPLRSMLKIVARYANNPLSTTRATAKGQSSESSDDESDASDGDGDDDEAEFGNYETEQLITAVSKITDLLRKCWGVAGADIISTNLATREGALTEVFNPTVPGKSVYALFAFAAINGFDHALKCLGGDVMILINDVAAVLHDEVYRWGFGDSGQCNKNLGAAFLMVFRIGLVKEVIQKLEEATNVVFSAAASKRTALKRKKKGDAQISKLSVEQKRKNELARLAIARNAAHNKKHNSHNKHDHLTEAMQLSLQSLPGISTFTDRAVIGMLKSFAGIHRDNKLRAWSRDFRLSAGVGTFSVSMIFGMDAGWAVEGAVGSEYKIDATYLSPHVNMASRMMSACKHYGVTILLSEAVQELMSDAARSKLRNLDRVTVKGSTRIQKIFTYDARHKGADFFLSSRSDEQADMEADRYVPSIWHTDQDLKAMRRHVTDDFETEYSQGMKAYLDGDWPAAIKRLETANEIMVEAAMEEGYLHDEMDDSPDRKELYRNETADGASVYLVNFMKSQGGVAPEGWAGWHPLLSK